MTNRNPRLARVIDTVYLTTEFSATPENDNRYFWKDGFRALIDASPFGIKGRPLYPLNQQLQRDLEVVFAPRGIVAFINCCLTCTHSYNEEEEYGFYDADPFFLPRHGGIQLFGLPLNGMNYVPSAERVIPVYYGSFDCINNNKTKGKTLKQH